MNLKVFNIFLSLLILISFSSCNESSQDKIPEEFILEQNYSISSEGDLIEDGYEGDGNKIVKDLLKNDHVDDKHETSYLNPFIACIFNILFIIITSILGNYKKAGIKYNTIMNIANMLGILLLGFPPMYLGLIFEIVYVTMGINVIIKYPRISGKKVRSEGIGGLNPRVCPNCGKKEFYVMDQVRLPNIYSNSDFYDIFYCKNCKIGNRPNELTKNQKVPYVDECSNEVKYIGSGLDTYSDDPHVRTIGGVIYYNYSYGFVHEGEFNFLGFNKSERSLVAISIVSDKITVIDGKEITEKSINEVFSRLYCGKECSIDEDKCSNSYGTCPKLNSISAALNPLVTHMNKGKMKGVIRKELEIAQCGKLCALNKGKSEVCNTKYCIITKILSEL